MDSYTEVRDHMDKTSGRMDMKSATVHSNNFGTVYTFRFKHGRSQSGSKARNNDNTEEHRTFVMSERSQYQINRNRIRANLFKFKYQGKPSDNEIENPRKCDSETSPCLDPEYSPMNQRDHTFSDSRLSDDSHESRWHPSSQSSYAATNSYPPEEDGFSVIPYIEDFTAYESVIQPPITYSPDKTLQPEIHSQTESVLLKELITPAILKPVVTIPTIFHSPSDEIELDYQLPIDTCSNISVSDLLCEVCNALPPAGTNLNICIKCNDMFCGVCELLPSSCHHVMAGSRKHKPSEKQPDPTPCSTRRRRVRKRNLPIEHFTHPLDDMLLKKSNDTEPPDYKNPLAIPSVYYGLNNSDDPLKQEWLKLSKMIKQLK